MYATTTTTRHGRPGSRRHRVEAARIHLARLVDQAHDQADASDDPIIAGAFDQLARDLAALEGRQQP